MNLLNFLFRASWRIVLASALIGGAGGAAVMGVVATIHVVLRQSEAVTQQVAWIFAGLCAMVLVTRIASQLLLVRLSQYALRDLCRYLCAQILEAPLRHLEQVGTHRLYVALTTDIQTIAMALNGIPVACVNLATLCFGMIFLWWLSSTMFVGVFLFLLFGITTYCIASREARRHFQIGREHGDILMRHLQTMTEGLKELKLHRQRREVFLQEVLAEATDDLRRHRTAGYSVAAIAISWGRLLFLVAIGLVLFVWPLFLETDAATLTGYTLTILFMMSPLERLMAWVPVLIQARVSLRKLDELGLAVEMGESSDGNVSPMTDWNEIHMASVTHTYRREREGDGFLLGPIDLTLTPGEILFIVGGNGSGKTTLVKLLTGLYTPRDGTVWVDGEAVGDDRREAYRQLFAAVFAEATLFESLLGMEGGRLDSNARELLEALHLDHAVSIENGVFSTTKLSKGQRKRLALLTAVLEDRPIFVFDEWAADQDPAFKAVFYQQILPKLKAQGKTAVVVTHDEHYFSVADRVVVLTDGQLNSSGRELSFPPQQVESNGER